jgi:hypothetical protein
MFLLNCLLSVALVAGAAFHSFGFAALADSLLEKILPTRFSMVLSGPLGGLASTATFGIMGVVLVHTIVPAATALVLAALYTTWAYKATKTNK